MRFIQSLHRWHREARELSLSQHAEVPQVPESTPQTEMGPDRDSSAYGVPPEVFREDAISEIDETLTQTQGDVDQPLQEMPEHAMDRDVVEQDPEVERAIDRLANALNMEPDSALWTPYTHAAHAPVDDAQDAPAADATVQKHAESTVHEEVTHVAGDAYEVEPVTLAAKLRAEALQDIEKQQQDIKAAIQKELAWQPTTSWLRPLKRDGEKRAHRARLDALAQSERALQEQELILQKANDTNEPQNLRRIIDTRTAIGLPPSTVAEQFATAFERSRWQGPIPAATALKGTMDGDALAHSTLRSPEQRRSADQRQATQEALVESQGWERIPGKDPTFIMGDAAMRVNTDTGRWETVADAPENTSVWAPLETKPGDLFQEEQDFTAQAQGAEIPEGITAVSQPEQEQMLISAGWRAVEGAPHTFERQGIQLSYDPKEEGYRIREGDGEWRTATHVRYGPAEQRSPTLQRIATNVAEMNHVLRDPWQKALRSLPASLRTTAAVQADTILRERGFAYDIGKGAFVNSANEEIRLEGTSWKAGENASVGAKDLVEKTLSLDLEKVRLGHEQIRPGLLANQRQALLREHTDWRETTPGTLVMASGQTLQCVPPYGWCLFDPAKNRWQRAESVQDETAKQLLAKLQSDLDATKNA